MTGFDIAVMIVVGLGAISGFMRGFVQESLALAAWIVALVAIHMALAPLSAWLLPYVHTTSGAYVLAFAILLLGPWFGIRLIGRRLGAASRNSLVGPVDRVLGFGFGAVKGTLVVVLVFAVVTLGYDVAWGRGGRPVWLTGARTYPFVNACSEKLLARIAARRAAAAGSDGDAAPADPDGTAGEPSPAPVPKHRHRHVHRAG